MGRQYQQKGTVGKNQHWQKESLYIEKDCFEKSQNYCNTGDSRTEYSSWRPCCHKNCLKLSFTNPISMVELQLLNLWLLRCVCHDHKTWTLGNACVIWSDELSFQLFPTSGWVYVWRTPKEAYNPEYLFPTVKHGGGSLMIWAAISSYSVGPIITLHCRITAREYVGRLGNQVHPMIQALFLNNNITFQDNTVPIHTPGTAQS
jgi:hypothetical protein